MADSCTVTDICFADLATATDSDGEQLRVPATEHQSDNDSDVEVPSNLTTELVFMPTLTFDFLTSNKMGDQD